MLPQELEQSLLQKEEELRMIQSKAAEMEQDLNSVLQEKQVSCGDIKPFNDVCRGACLWMATNER